MYNKKHKISFIHRNTIFFKNHSAIKLLLYNIVLKLFYQYSTTKLLIMIQSRNFFLNISEFIHFTSDKKKLISIPRIIREITAEDLKREWQQNH